MIQPNLQSKGPVRRDSDRNDDRCHCIAGRSLRNLEFVHSGCFAEFPARRHCHPHDSLRSGQDGAAPGAFLQRCHLKYHCVSDRLNGWLRARRYDGRQRHGWRHYSGLPGYKLCGLSGRWGPADQLGGRQLHAAVDNFNQCRGESENNHGAYNGEGLDRERIGAVNDAGLYEIEYLLGYSCPK